MKGRYVRHAQTHLSYAVILIKIVGISQTSQSAIFKLQDVGRAPVIHLVKNLISATACGDNASKVSTILYCLIAQSMTTSVIA